MNFDKFELNANIPNGAGPCLAPIVVFDETFLKFAIQVHLEFQIFEKTIFESLLCSASTFIQMLYF